MIHPDDVAAWIAQVCQEPEAAPGIIEALAARLIELDRQNEALRDELLRLRRSGETAGDGERLAALARRVQDLERQLTREAPVGAAARSLLILTLDGRGARLPVHAVETWWREGAGRQELVAGHLRPRFLRLAPDDAELLLVSDKGRARGLRVADLALEEAPVNYLSLLSGLRLDVDEAVSVVAPVPPAFDRMTLVTRKGYARSLRRAEVDSLLERNLPLHSSPVAGDYPAYVLFGDGKGEILIVSRGGKGVRFPERQVGVQAKPAIDLERGDVVVGAILVDDSVTVLLVAAGGRAARRQMSGFGAHPTAGHRGKLVTRVDDLVAVAPVEAGDSLWMLTASGGLLVVPARRVPAGPGASGGKRIARLGKDPVVAVALTAGAKD